MVAWLPAAHSSTEAVPQTVTDVPTVASVHTQAPSVTLALRLTETPTLTPLPTLTSTPKASDTPLPTATPTITPTSTPMICAIAVYKAFERIWESHKEELGCALYDANLNLLMAHEIFERGSMIWRQDDDRIYALYNSGIWVSFEDIWKEGDAEFTCGTPANPPTPKRGLGKIWCTYDEVRNGLGDATTAEVGQYGKVQLFEHGFVLQTQYGDIFVFLYTGRWWQN